MIHYNVTGIERKKLVQTLTRITGEPSVYLGMPTCGFRVGDLTVGKHGEVSPHPSEDIIAKLAEAGFVGEEQVGGPVITIPRRGMTDTAITCLQNILNSKRSLIRKALGLQSTLPIEVTEDAIVARWFDLEEPENFGVAKKLMEAMVRASKRAKRVDPTPVRSDNPKYSFRVFLNALGFTGDEHKALRKELLKNLEGSSAYRHGKPEEAQGHPTMVRIQATRKDGSWGKVRETRTYGNETPEQVIERLTKLNPGTRFKLAEEVEG